LYYKLAYDIPQLLCFQSFSKLNSNMNMTVTQMAWRTKVRFAANRLSVELVQTHLLGYPIIPDNIWCWN